MSETVTVEEKRAEGALARCAFCTGQVRRRQAFVPFGVRGTYDTAYSGVSIEVTRQFPAIPQKSSACLCEIFRVVGGTVDRFSAKFWTKHSRGT